jgi:hypothetical protein
MLKAIHSYTSHFYSALARSDGHNGKNDASRQRRIDERSMDETALLAFGILLEEAGRDVLGKRGDMVFTEGMDADTQRSSGIAEGCAVGFLDVDPIGLHSKRANETKPTVHEHDPNS